MNLYPLKFSPIYIKKIWGGTRLKTNLNRNIEEDNIGESWEISINNKDISLISNGIYKNIKLDVLIKKFPKQLIGKDFNSDDRFPLLLKIIDANQKLSLQVHPDDKFAKKYENGNGKTEMWYVLSSSPKGKLYIGLKDIYNKDNLKKVIEEGNLEDYLNEINVNEGDFFFVPPGTVHAIGGGLMIVEIQQNSNITYRLYDWDRVDNKETKRKLHLKKGVAATKFKEFEGNNKVKYSKITDQYKKEILCISEYFVTEKISIKNSIKINNDKFSILVCINGNGIIYYDDNNTEKIKSGESLLIPAALKNITLRGKMKLLYIYIPDNIKSFKNKLLKKGYRKHL